MVSKTNEKRDSGHYWRTHKLLRTSARGGPIVGSLLPPYHATVSQHPSYADKQIGDHIQKQDPSRKNSSTDIYGGRKSRSPPHLCDNVNF